MARHNRVGGQLMDLAGGPRSNRARAHRSGSVRLSFEPLEIRRMLSATVQGDYATAATTLQGAIDGGDFVVDPENYAITTVSGIDPSTVNVDDAGEIETYLSVDSLDDSVLQAISDAGGRLVGMDYLSMAVDAWVQPASVAGMAQLADVTHIGLPVRGTITALPAEDTNLNVPEQTFGDPENADAASAAPTGQQPSQIQTVYGYGTNIGSFTGGAAALGMGQTIAIVIAFKNPNIKADLDSFDARFSLPAPPFLNIMPVGAVPNDPAGTTDSWGLEASLDVEWAHAIAPNATIDLIETADASSSLYEGAAIAAATPGVSVVSMSWGAPESGFDVGVGGSNIETSLDSNFTTPSGHSNVAFVAATGDFGAPGNYPAFSPNVLAVGGTNLALNSDNTRMSELGWVGSGGGVSTAESQPAFQNGVVSSISTTNRTTPDVSSVAFGIGVAIYDSYDNGVSTPWSAEGGTSVATPIWAGTVAVADQDRAANGMAVLSNSALETELYGASSSNFFDVTSGNNGFAAHAGYDLVTGRGSPVANVLVPSLMYDTFTPPAPTMAGNGHNQVGYINTPTPTFTGTAPINSYVTVYVDSAIVGHEQLSGDSGSYSIPSTVTLSSGTHSVAVRVSQSASASDLSNSSPSVNITVDTTAPFPSVSSITPNPRNVAVPSDTVNFNEAVYGVSNSNFTLTNGGSNLLSGATFAPSNSNMTWTIGNLAGLTGAYGTNWSLALANDTGIYNAAGIQLSGTAAVGWKMAPWQNLNSGGNVADVTDNGSVSPQDVAGEALALTNYNILVGLAPTTNSAVPPAPYNLYLDATGDNNLTPADLLVTVDSAKSGAHADATVADEGTRSARIRLTAVDMDGNPITSVQVGQQFRVEELVTDTSDGPTGVFAVFNNLNFDSGLATATGDVTFPTGLPFVLSSDPAAGVRNAGAVLAEDDTYGAESLVFTSTFTANTAGVLSLTTSADGLMGHDLLEFDNQDPVPTEDIDFGSLNLTIFHPPAVNLTGTAGAYDRTAIWSGAPVALADVNNATITDPSSGTLQSLSVTLASAQTGDVLAATTTGTGISASFAGGTLSLSGSDSLADYQQVLRSITYNNTTGSTGVSSESVTIVANDGTNNGNTATATIDIPPIVKLSNVAGATDYTGNWYNSGAVPMQNMGLAAIYAHGNPNITSLTVALTTFHTGDVLSVATLGGVSLSLTSSYANGTLTLSGTDTLAHYQQALQFINYDNTDGDPGVSSIAATVVASDGTLSSTPATSTININVASGQILGNRLFYNNSKFDGNNGAINSSDDSAIASDKVGFNGTGTATFNSITSFNKGITGVMVDIENGLGSHGLINLTSGDVTFLVSPVTYVTTSYDQLSTWSAAPTPANISVRLGAGTGGSDRLEITWGTGVIKNTWLQVTVKADANTGLSADDVFYFGSVVGDSGLVDTAALAKTDGNDYNAAFNNIIGLTTPTWNVFDYTRDGKVDGSDASTAIGNIFSLHYVIAPY